MCGIAGFCGFGQNFTDNYKYWAKVLVDMRTSIAHRGSDNMGEYLTQHLGFSHTRLSIRDLTNGAQPIIREHNGAVYVIIYNGEIYNTDELKPELEAAGYVFETTTDTEVILYAYMHWGVDSFEKLNGIYAFAIWDGTFDRLVLCRDRFGIKPLFYTLKNNILIFGSEPKALFRHPYVVPSVNTDSFREVFGIGPARTAGNGVFKNVSELRPAHYAVFSRDGLSETCYWELKSRRHTDSYEDTVETVSFLVRDAITRQMVSDVPVCSFLSGGLDSSIVTAVASKILSDEGSKLNTFSFDFRQNDVYFKANSFQPERDRPYVDEMLACCETNHTYLECDEAELVGLLNAAVDAKDMPGMADVDASLLYFCRLVKQHNKVVLTGECADEIFGGYPWFYRKELLRTDGFPWSRDLETRTMLLREDFKRSLDLDEYVRARYEESLNSVPALPGENKEERRRREVSYLNIKWFMQTLLDRMDRASMYSGLEARVPFADHRIVEYLFNVPWDMKYREGREKSLLRDACRDLLPEKILYRKKSPYPKTYNPNYERLLSEKLMRIVSDPYTPLAMIIDRKKAADFIKAPSEYGKPWFGQLMAGPQLMAYMIQVNYWMEKYKLA
ncbi:MAG: asparagine synthase (glutamine-hydrolyzing) [Oscillospiraceae bacterium]|nr:asparagine synthase (glutamine-hydrolyzing) [Oscillospiraceae bacterium]